MGVRSRRFLRGGDGSPLQVFVPEKFHGQRSLVGYSPWGHRHQETDTTEQLNTLLETILLILPVEM